MKQYLLDTCIVVDYLRKNKKAASFLSSLEEPVISVITAGEVYQGCRNKKELKEIKKTLRFFNIMPINEEVSQLSLEFLEKHTLSFGLLILDSLIAATAVKNNLILITANVKHFKMIKTLKLEKWPPLSSPLSPGSLPAGEVG